LKIFSGRISDRLGKRKALVLLGYGVSTIARPLMGVASSAWNVVALRFLDRIGKGVRTSPRDALIGDSVPKEYRGLAFSFHRSMDHAGAVLGPISAFLILLALIGGARLWSDEKVATPEEMTALKWLFGLSLIPGLFAMAALVFMVREVAPSGQKSGQEKKLAGWRDLPGRFYAFVAVVTLFALGNSSDLFILLYGKARFDLGMGSILALWVLLHVSKIIFSFPGGIFSDRLGRRPIIIAGWIGYALIYLGLAQIGVAWEFWALFVAYGFYYGMTEGAEKALVTDFVPSEQRGTAFGVYHGAVGLAALPANLLFAFLWSQFGPLWAFGVGAALAGLAAVLLVVLLASSKKPQVAVAA
jgi:MFS family permease